jgi:3-hydroxyisobutyrate dehydrogenase-like beta-hydroxyacid dehydrogenase
MKIAFLGLGNMGGGMAANLLKGGFDLTVYDIDRDKSTRLVEAGARWANSVSEAVRDANVVITSLPTPSIIKEVATSTNGIIDSAQRGATWIETSTNDLNVWGEVRTLASRKGIDTLDAPISGGAEGAAAGTLTILIGGDQAVYERCKPIFNAIGKRIEYLGKPGAGYVAKIAQVVLCYVHSIALSEALMLGMKGGVSPQKMLDIIRSSTGRSYVADRYGPCILSGDYDPTFELGLALKDMRLTMELAAQVSAQLPLCNHVEKTYVQACEKFGIRAPHLMAVKLLEEANALPLRS